MKIPVKLNLTRDATLIRRAFSGGQRIITLHGVKMKLTRQDRTPVVQVGGESKKVKESWIIARPVNGDLLPSYSVELKEQGNMRTAATKL